MRRFFNELNIRNLLKTDKPIVFVRCIDNIITRRKFPTKNIFLVAGAHAAAGKCSTFRLFRQPIISILIFPFFCRMPQTLINLTEYVAQTVVDMASFAFSKILMNFPPSCSPCRPVYRQLIIETIAGADCKLPKGTIGFEHE